MQEVTIKINKGRPEVFNLCLPTSWDELTREQLLYIAKYWTGWQLLIENDMSLTQARALLFISFTGIKNGKQLARICDAIAGNDESLTLINTTDFVFKELKLTKNLIPKIPVGIFKRYYGPADKLSDLSVDEFSFAFSCYSNYNRTRNEDFLLKLSAVLYRPKNKNFKNTGELRVPFNHKMISHYEKELKSAPEEYHQAVYIFFRGCVEYLGNAYKEIFQRGEKSQASGGGFIDAVIAMSGGKFGPFETTKRENIYIIFKELKELIKKAEETK